MKINIYDVILNEDRVATLEKKEKTSYEAFSLDNPSKIYRIICDVFRANVLPEEHTWVIAVNGDNFPIGIFEVSCGAGNYTIINSREVFMRLCLIGAIRFIVVHNHPSGNPRPSSEDFQSTQKLIEAGKMMCIPMMDHVIAGDASISKHSYFSFYEEFRKMFE